MVRWMHGFLTEKLKPCNMHMQIFHFIIRCAYLQEGKRVFSFGFENQKFPDNYFEQIKIKDKQHISNSFFFSKAIKGVRVSFVERKTTSTVHAYALYFFNISWNINRSNLKLHYFFFWWDSTNARETKEQREPESLWG